jgi:hypothetical protein
MMMLLMEESEDYYKANSSFTQMLTVEFIWLVYKSRNDNIKKKIQPVCLIYNGKVVTYLFTGEQL